MSYRTECFGLLNMFVRTRRSQPNIIAINVPLDCLVRCGGLLIRNGPIGSPQPGGVSICII